MSALLKALAEPRRVRIIGLTYGQELPAGAIHRALGDVTFGAVSQHLRLLTEAGALRVRREGRRRLYQADEAVLSPFREHLEELWDNALLRLRALAQAAERRHGRSLPAGPRTKETSRTVATEGSANGRWRRKNASARRRRKNAGAR